MPNMIWRQPTVTAVLMQALLVTLPLLLVGVLTAPAAEPHDLVGQTAQGPFKPDWPSLHAHQDPEWFREAKFGIYTHWGPVTVGCEDAPQGGEWYGREMYLTNNPIFAWHRQKFGDQHAFGYKDLISRFTAPKFDPEKWADLFARAGAKFAGPVAVHHDNFALWDSAVAPWNSMKMGPKRDITVDSITPAGSTEVKEGEPAGVPIKESSRKRPRRTSPST